MSLAGVEVADVEGVCLASRYVSGPREPGYYTDRDAAAYWDGRNAAGEPVVSGAYFYTLGAGDPGESHLTRRMVILK